jgi:hypothetical protein
MSSKSSSQNLDKESIVDGAFERVSESRTKIVLELAVQDTEKKRGKSRG